MTPRTVIEHDVPTVVRDGTVLRCDVWRRDDGTRRPAVLFRTPYDKSAPPLGTLAPAQCVAADYVAVVQDTRGRFRSEGPWSPLEWSHEGPDGYDTVEWVAEQPWCDGNVVMAGTSYQAIVQWLAAMERPPHLRAIAPAMSTSAALDHAQMGGALRLDHLTSWLALTATEWMRRRRAAGEDVPAAVGAEVLSLLTEPHSSVLDRPPPEILDFEGFPGRIRDVVRGRLQTMSDYDLDAVEVPTLSVGGWYDVFAHGTVELHRSMRARSDGAGRHELVMGPWVHGGQLPQTTGVLNTGLFGSAAGAALAQRHLDFFDRHVGRPTGDPHPPVSYFLLGANAWRRTSSWPPPEAVTVEFRLEPAGPTERDALTALRCDGPPAGAAAATHPAHGITFTYDGDHPVPTQGGRVLQLGTQVAGPLDQSHLEGRPDVVTYTTAPAPLAVEVVGRQTLRLDHRADAETTDLAVRLCDVHPDGRSLLVAEGHHRPGSDAGKARRVVTVALGDTAWRLQPGHRLRLSVTCGNFPQVDRHPGLDARRGPDGSRPTTTQTVFHGPASDSVLTLQVTTPPGTITEPPAEGTMAPPTTLGPSAPSAPRAGRTDADDVLDPGDPQLPTREQCVLEPLLRHRADRTPSAIFAVFDDGTSWDYAATLDAAERTAAALQAIGVEAGDRVASWLPNGADALRTWFGINLAGATSVPINVAYRGAMLTHVLGDSGARTLVTRPSLAAHLAGVETGSLTTVVLLPGPDGRAPLTGVAELEARGISVVIGADADADAFAGPQEAVQPWDVQTIIYTSGTTGPSKGVLSSYAHLYSSATAAFAGRTHPSDRYLLQLPLFHAGGTIGVYGMLVHGASVAVVHSFRTDQFWSVVRSTSTTLCTLLGVMATYLLQAPATANDTDHGLREAFIIPLGDTTRAFSQRFGVRVHALFNMTELSCPLIGLDAPDVTMYAGHPRPGIEARLVDSADRDVPPGEVGELVVRAARPWAFGHAYLGRPDATADAWRNGWFHTGDSFRRTDDGGFVFVDRLKDAIRRRGENISSFEVEAQTLAHPGVREAAAVAVPGDEGEDEVLVVVSPTGPGATIDPVDLCRHLGRRLAHFMVPRYVRVVPQLPLTATHKPRKDLLRREGITADTWDRHLSDLAVRAERVR